MRNDVDLSIKDPEPARLMQYERKMLQYKSQVYVCQIIYQKVSTFTSFVKAHLKKEYTTTVMISAEECQKMVKFEKCAHGNEER